MGEKIYQSNIDSKKRYNDKLSTFQIDKNLHLEVKEYCKNNNLKVKDFLENIINTQFNEINFMKNKLRKI
jgi:hypothetical protein